LTFHDELSRKRLTSTGTYSSYEYKLTNHVRLVDLPDARDPLPTRQRW